MRPIHWLLLVVLSMLWGATFMFVKEALPYVPPLSLTLSRVAIAAFVLVPIVFMLGQRMPNTARAWRDFAGMSVLNNIVPFALIFFGQTMVGAGLASVLNAATPLMTLLAARGIAGEPQPAHKFVGVGIGMVGVATLIGPSVWTGDKTSALGMLLVLGATLSYGLSALWGRRFKDMPPIVSAASQLTCSTLLLLPIAGVADRFWALPMPPSQVLWSIAGLGVLSTALAYILFFKIMREAGSNNVMLVTLLIPLSGVTLGALRFGEVLTTNQSVGALIIAASLLVIDGRLFQKPVVTR